jgi:hypothetical protein
MDAAAPALVGGVDVRAGHYIVLEDLIAAVETARARVTAWHIEATLPG